MCVAFKTIMSHEAGIYYIYSIYDQMKNQNAGTYENLHSNFILTDFLCSTPPSDIVLYHMAVMPTHLPRILQA